MIQSYVSTEQVRAWPQERDGQPGYAVEHEDKRTSWYPKGVFENSNLPIGNVDHLQPYQRRIVEEAAQLTDRLLKLNHFVETDAFGLMQTEDKRLLLTQALHMALYLKALTARMEMFA